MLAVLLWGCATEKLQRSRTDGKLESFAIMGEQLTITMGFNIAFGGLYNHLSGFCVGKVLLVVNLRPFEECHNSFQQAFALQAMSRIHHIEKRIINLC